MPVFGQNKYKTYHTFLNTQPIFIKRSAYTSYLFEASVHLKVTPQYAVVFYTSPNKYSFQYFDFARISAENCRKHFDEWLSEIMRRYVHFIA